MNVIDAELFLKEFVDFSFDLEMRLNGFEKALQKYVILKRKARLILTKENNYYLKRVK